MLSKLKEDSLGFALRVWGTTVLLSPILIALYDFCRHFQGGNAFRGIQNDNAIHFYAALFFSIILGGLFSLPILVMLTYSVHSLGRKSWKKGAKKASLAIVASLFVLLPFIPFVNLGVLRWSIIYWLTAVASVFFYKMPESAPGITEFTTDQTSRP